MFVSTDVHLQIVKYKFIFIFTALEVDRKTRFDLSANPSWDRNQYFPIFILSDFTLELLPNRSNEMYFYALIWHIDMNRHKSQDKKKPPDKSTSQLASGVPFSLLNYVKSVDKIDVTPYLWQLNDKGNEI